MSAFPLERPLKTREVEYPSSDGEPMGETDLHRDETIYVILALQEHFREVPDVYVSGDLLLYYVEGEPRFCVSPDVLVAKGLADAKAQRDIYKLWEEGRMPCWVMEVTSRSTRDEDLNKKKDLYRRLGVEEYFLFDPREEYLAPPLQGFRLSGFGGEYRQVDPEEDGSLLSQELGVVFCLEGHFLRLIDVQTGRRYLRDVEKLAELREKDERLHAAEERAAREAQARQALEAEIVRLRRLMEPGKKD